MSNLFSPAVIAGHLFTLWSALICVLWGIGKASRPAPSPDEPEETVRSWTQDERQIEENL